MINCKNPILSGFYPDPSICRVGEWFYLVNSTFAYYPGIPIFRSRNLAAILFGLSLFLSPIFLAIPSFATAPALIIVGFLMLTSVTKIDFNDMTEAIPAFIAIIAMPFLYSISEGISMGVISYVIINVVTGKANEKKISALMYVLAVLFILKYIFI